MTLNGRDSVSNHQPHDCLLNRLFRRRSKKTSKFRVTGLCAGNSPGTGEFPAQMASLAENVSIWWRHRDILCSSLFTSIPPRRASCQPEQLMNKQSSCRCVILHDGHMVELGCYFYYGAKWWNFRIPGNCESLDPHRWPNDQVETLIALSLLSPWMVLAFTL